MEKNSADKIWELLSSISEKKQNAAIRKCAELNFSQSKGVISLYESFVNLSQIRDILMDVIQRGKINRLPFPTQVAIANKLEAISRNINELASGKDVVDPLVSDIDELFIVDVVNRVGMFN